MTKIKLREIKTLYSTDYKVGDCHRGNDVVVIGRSFVYYDGGDTDGGICGFIRTKARLSSYSFQATGTFCRNGNVIYIICRI